MRPSDCYAARSKPRRQAFVPWAQLKERREIHVGNMLVVDYLRPAAIKACVTLKPGQRFGFHNLRHSLSSLLITGNHNLLICGAAGNTGEANMAKGNW